MKKIMVWIILAGLSAASTFGAVPRSRISKIGSKRTGFSFRVGFKIHL